MPVYYSDWTELQVNRLASAPTLQAMSIYWSLPGLVESEVFSSKNAISAERSYRRPGGFLTWIAKSPSGETEFHGCQVHETVECAALHVPPLTETSEIGAPFPKEVRQSFSPYRNSPTARIDLQGYPRFVCAAGDLPTVGIESTQIGRSTKELPSQYPVRHIRTSHLEGRSNEVSFCAYLESGNIYAMVDEEDVNFSSSSSSSSSESSISSSSSSSISSSSSSSISSSSQSTGTSGSSSMSSSSSISSSLSSISSQQI